MRTQLQFGRLHVRIHWGIALCITLTLALLVNLGFWQLGRAADKRALQREMQARQELPAMALEQVQPRSGSLSEAEAAQIENLRVSVSGRYWNEASFLVAFQFFQGAPGFELVTPFLVAGSEEALLVSRGWIAPGPGDDGMPFVVPVEGEQTLTGQLHVPPAVVGVTQVEGEAWPLRLRRMDVSRAAEVLDRPVLPWVLRLSADSAGVHARHWPAVTVSTRSNIQYALQWFGMALLVLVASLAFSTNLLGLLGARGASSQAPEPH